jgi:hypothetical protein
VIAAIRSPSSVSRDRPARRCGRAGRRRSLGAGLRLLPWTATLFFVAPVAGRRIARTGERPFVAAGLALQAAGLAWIALIAAPGVGYPRLVAPFTTMRQLGGAFGVAVAVAVFAGAGSYASPGAFSAGFGPAIGVAAAVSLAGALAGLALPGTAARTAVRAAALDSTA